METKDRFGAWLADQLARRGWGQADLHRAAGVSRQVVSNWIKGDRLPEAASCFQIAEALNLDADLVLYMAGHRRDLPRPVGEYERDRMLREALAGLRRLEEATDAEESPVRFYGRVPADSVRWISAEETGTMVSVLRRWLGARSPQDFLLVEASGDCLRNQGILSGFYVLLDRRPGRAPRNGEVVLVRLVDEFSLKIWDRDGDWVTLRDGAGVEVARFSILSEFEVVGVYVTSWREPNKR